jgi:MerR family transcriptional regulator/heat shock protein HspR
MGDTRNRRSEIRGRGSSRGGDAREQSLDDARGVFMISVAADLAGMHPQTLRVYEARGLIKPSRSPKKTRLYSQRDVARLRRIQELTSEFGLNLAGVERVLALEAAMAEMHSQLERLREQAERMEQDMLSQIEAVHRSYKRELVRWEPPGTLLSSRDAKPFKIRVTRGDGAADRTGGDQTRRGEGRRG